MKNGEREDWLRVLAILLVGAAIMLGMFLCGSGCGLNSGDIGTRDAQVATSQPVEVSQDNAAVLAKLDTMEAKVTAIGLQVNSTKTVTYGSDVWASRLAIAMIGLYALVKAGLWTHSQAWGRKRRFHHVSL